MRKEMVAELARFQTKTLRGSFKDWLITNHERYSQYLARLEAPAEPQP